MAVKKKSIFSALDGSHLDSALFGSHVSKTNKGDKNAQNEQTRVSRRNGLRRGGQNTASDRGKTGR